MRRRKCRGRHVLAKYRSKSSLVGGLGILILAVCISQDNNNPSRAINLKQKTLPFQMNRQNTQRSQPTRHRSKGIKKFMLIMSINICFLLIETFATATQNINAHPSTRPFVVIITHNKYTPLSLASQNRCRRNGFSDTYYDPFDYGRDGVVIIIKQVIKYWRTVYIVHPHYFGWALHGVVLHIISHLLLLLEQHMRGIQTLCRCLAYRVILQNVYPWNEQRDPIGCRIGTWRLMRWTEHTNNLWSKIRLITGKTNGIDGAGV